MIIVATLRHLVVTQYATVVQTVKIAIQVPKNLKHSGFMSKFELKTGLHNESSWSLLASFAGH